MKDTSADSSHPGTGRTRSARYLSVGRTFGRIITFGRGDDGALPGRRRGVGPGARRTTGAPPCGRTSRGRGDGGVAAGATSLGGRDVPPAFVPTVEPETGIPPRWPASLRPFDRVPSVVAQVHVAHVAFLACVSPGRLHRLALALGSNHELAPLDAVDPIRRAAGMRWHKHAVATDGKPAFEAAADR